MENSFVNGLKKETNITYTENGMEAYKTTNSDLLDMFASIGSLRTRSAIDIEQKFAKAFAQDNLLAMKMLFYCRNIRGGLGERRTFNILTKYMATYHTEAMRKNLWLIPVFGRWSDFYSFVGTPLEDEVFEYIKDQILEDLGEVEREGNRAIISLCAKWLKSTSKVSRESMKLGKLTARKLGYTYKEYRQVLSKLRKQLNIVERNMSENNWDSINYGQVPSLAMKKYRNAFREHNLVEFKEYVKKVQNGEEKINAETLYPYDILRGIGLQYDFWNRKFTTDKWDEVLEEQWKALPNYVNGENNILVVCDTSASMEGRPMETAIGLSLYFAERNKGAFKNLFMTFSHKPKLVEVKGSNLQEKVRCIESEVANTDIEAAFNLVLTTLLTHNVPQEECPKALIFITDGEFDSMTDFEYTGYRNMENDCIDHQSKIMDKMQEKFAKANYDLPKIIFWNVDSRSDNYAITSEYKNVILVSGQSVSTFKNVLASIDADPVQFMLDTLNDKMYDCVTV
jgi:hypothetical protein